MGLACGMQKIDENAYRYFVGKPEEKRSLERLGSKWEDNIEMNLQKIGTERERERESRLDSLFRKRQQSGYCEYCIEISCSIDGRKILE
jgi:hypothetical protein